MSRPDLSTQLHELATKVRRLCPCHRDPEQFHLDKSEIEAALHQLSRATGRAGSYQPNLNSQKGKRA